jgi:hypothetical protein
MINNFFLSSTRLEKAVESLVYVLLVSCLPRKTLFLCLNGNSLNQLLTGEIKFDERFVIACFSLEQGESDTKSSKGKQARKVDRRKASSLLKRKNLS